MSEVEQFVGSEVSERPGQVNAWDRRDGERAQTHQKFMYYCELGAARSLLKVAERYGISAGAVFKLSRIHHWVQRAEAWDVHQRLNRDVAASAARAALLERELKDVQAMFSQWDVLWHDAEKRQSTDTREWRSLVDMHRRIADQARRAVGLPERVNEQQMTGSAGANLPIIFIHADEAPPGEDEA